MLMLRSASEHNPEGAIALHAQKLEALQPAGMGLQA